MYCMKNFKENKNDLEILLIIFKYDIVLKILKLSLKTFLTVGFFSKH